MGDWEDILFSRDGSIQHRSSPELWPESIPGVTEYAAKNSLNGIFTTDGIEQKLSEDDLRLVNYYRTWSKEDIIEELKKLKETVYELGIDEYREITRGRFLNILSRKRK